ncbi:MAG TPA: TOBE domain-containing protein, partial [Gammaproteobacteria bacterium]|nr:TOBE domain-containing protein [Gammaproteobacteria bacterium]
DQRMFRTDSGTVIPLVDDTAVGGKIVFRPQNVEIRSAVAGAGVEGTGLSGVVHHTEFLGSIIRYGVDVNGDDVLVDHTHRYGESVFRTGDRVELTIAPEGILLLEG